MIEETIERPSSGYFSGLTAGRRISSLMRSALEKLFPEAQSDRRIFIEERLAIGPKKALILVNCVGRRFLLATTTDVITPMGEVLPFTEGSSRGESPAATRQQETL